MFPIIFDSKFFALHSLWVFLVIALMSMTYFGIWLSVKNGLKVQFLSENLWKLFIWALIGARLLGIIENYDFYFSDFSLQSIPRFFFIWDKGLSVWGAIFAFFVSFYFTCKKNEQNYLKWLDTLVPAFLVGIAIRSIGAFFEGINYGNETGLPWGVNFEKPEIKYTVPIHPAQIYAFIYCGLLITGLTLFGQSKKFKEKDYTGIIGISGILIFSFLAFLEQFLRGDDVLTVFDIRIPQVIAILSTIISGIILFLRYNELKGKKFKFPKIRIRKNPNNLTNT